MKAMPSIALKDVSVDLPIYNSRGRSLKSVLAQTVGGGVADDRDRSVVVIRALDHVSLHLEHGARVALIGANGSGKTTLLRVMAKIYPPTHGVADIVGRIACLTDLNVGMDLEATGYENIRMRGVLLGLTQREIAKLVPDVAEFTELGEYSEAADTLLLPRHDVASGLRHQHRYAARDHPARRDHRRR